MKEIYYKNYMYLIGQNASENDHLVKTQSREYYWFHLEHQPSCHVILQSSLINENKKTRSIFLRHGALLCKQHSKCIQHKPINIMFTHLQNVDPTEIVGTVNVIVYNVITL